MREIYVNSDLPYPPTLPPFPPVTTLGMWNKSSHDRVKIWPQGTLDAV